MEKQELEVCYARRTFMWSSPDWVEDMIMVESIIMDKADMNDLYMAEFNLEQEDMDDHNATDPT